MDTLATTQPHAHATIHALHAHRCELATTLPRAHPPCMHAHPRFHGAGWTRWLRRQAEAIRSREASRSNTLTFQCTPTFHLNLGSRPYVIGATKLVAYGRGLALDEPLPVCLNRAFRRQPLVEPLPVRHELSTHPQLSSQPNTSSAYLIPTHTPALPTSFLVDLPDFWNGILYLKS
jgi:hypothetical protein